MQSFQKFRRYEFWFILLAFTIYITRRLFQLAARFDRDVELAEQSTKNASADFLPRTIHSVWESLASYNHALNTIFPTIAGGVLLFLAWATFHYMAFPRWKSKGQEQSLFFTYLFLTAVFSLASVFFYDFFKLYWRFRLDNSGQIIDFKVYSLFRKVHLLSNTIALLAIIGIYEITSQFYYFIKTKLYEEPEKNYQYLDILLIVFILLSFLFFAVFGQLPVSFWNGGLRDVVLVPLFLGIAYGAHKIFTEKVMPHISAPHSKEFSTGITLFFLVCGIGSFIFQVVEIVFWLSKGFSRIEFSIKDLVIVFVWLVLLSVIAAFLRSVFFKEKLQLTQLFTQKTAELSSLRSQINPHFLFNALNTLYSVSLKENADKTADGIQKLGDMMRFMLNENNQDRIPLNKEIEYLQNYIEIQRMRIAESDNIEIKINIQPSDRDIFIAPMLLNPFIENAFKHGISFRNPSWIYITLTFDDTRLYFKVHNSLHAKSESDPEKDNNGIGLENVKKRLDLIYKNRYALDIQKSEQDFFVSLTITYW
ncbi:sensor histidine kinase [Emticicia agri]|uniref:Sensor protein lytS n=1 Tax=Emticicia agri TaxID=2492393 RepID=A0A4Q5M388_9BACT|nr:histidine kinase [Emticicia agri]RYU96778.1 sensor protein lytS [Emticicia agri]